MITPRLGGVRTMRRLLAVLLALLLVLMPPYWVLVNRSAGGDKVAVRRFAVAAPAPGGPGDSRPGVADDGNDEGQFDDDDGEVTEPDGGDEEGDDRQDGEAKFDDLVGKLASSGVEFSGQPFRKYPADRLVFSGNNKAPEEVKVTSVGDPRCKSQKWAVLTTVSEPMEAVRRLLYRTKWCLVVVGDRVGPKSFGFDDTDLGDNIVFLDEKEQRAMGSSFVDSTPWNSFARKNVGFLYAVAAGAEVIWDFDDDNMLNFWIEGASPDPNLELETFTKRTGKLDVLVPVMEGDTDFNPYPLMGCPKEAACWARGFPLRSVFTRGRPPPALAKETVDRSSIAVLQSLADHDPDVDAIFRLTMGTPWNFNRKVNIPPVPVLLPATGAFSPMNAQATLYFRPGFFSLYLPVTVHGRVTDIWRSYIGEAVCQVLGLRSGFLPRPLVVQDRNPHSYMADFDAEIPLYKQSGALVDFLAGWVTKKKEERQEGEEPPCFKALTEEVYVNMYESGFLEAGDVEGVQAWLRAFDGVTRGREDSNTEVTEHIRMDVGKVVSSSVADGGSKAVCKETEKDLKFYKVDHSSEKAYNQLKASLDAGKISDLPAANALVCHNPAALCQQVQEKSGLDKKVAFLPSHRYNLGRCSAQDWKALDAWLASLHEGDGNLLGATSRYDVEYLRYYTGLPDLRIVPNATSASSRVSDATAADAKKAKGAAIIFDDRRDPDTPSHLMSLAAELARSSKFKFTPLSSSRPADLSSQEAVVFLAHLVSSHRLEELFALGVPVMTPSAAYWAKRGGFGPSRLSISHRRCDKAKSATIVDPMEEEQKDSAASVGRHPSVAIHPYDPNVAFSEDSEAEMYWLQMADIYDWPHVTHFDNVTDLEGKLASMDLVKVRERMRRYRQIRERTAASEWCKFVEKISTNTRT